ncbi:autotransporter domain-containing protein [Rickettsia typhi]|uniref:autotransporter domain-containing protein n=1 Tax=Rickettsia typhi TaxID=785 RepID=UPI001E290AB2|nr:autotransporter domain-containing protein [Rickettsia typhi]
MQFSQSLEVPTPTGEFGKKYSKLINPKTSKQNLKIEFPKKIISLVRDELTLKYFTADIERILTLFSKKDDLILSEAKEKYKEVIQDPYIAQFTNKNQNTGSFLENKLFEETREEAILRLLSLEQLDAQMKKEILSKQGDILEQLKFINANTEILGSYGQTASTDILKKIPKELPKILSKQGDILEQLKFINANTEILNEHSKAILKDKLKELSKQLDEISSNQLVGFILDENKINTNLKNVHFSEKKVRETVSNLNNKILEKIFLKDDGTITEQDLTKILQKHQETVLIKNLTKAIVYIDGNKNNATVNKTLEKCLEQTTPEQQELILDVLTHNTRIRTVLITKIEREQRQNHNKKLNKNIAGDSFVDALKKALVHRTSNSETILKVVEQRKQETPKNLNVWDRISQNIPNLNNQNVQDENNKEWDESNKNADDLNNTNIYMITKHDLERAVNETITKFSAMSTLLKDKKNAGAYQRYLKEAEDQLALAQEKGKELIKNSAQTFKIIPKKYQDDINENWQNYLSPAEMIELTALNEHTNTLKSNKNKSGHFRSSEEALQYKAKQHEYYTLLAELKKIGIAKQQEKLVKDYVDEMITNAKQAVEKFERTSLEHINQKKENKQISKEILDAQERLENAKQKIEFIKFKYIISNKRQVNSSDEDSDDDADKNAIKQKTELENAQKDINQAKKNLEDAKAKYAALQITLNYSPNGMDSKTTEDQEQFKTDNIAAESLEDMAVMFKDSEEAAERKEEVTLNYSPNGMDSKTTEDQEQFKTDNIAESLEDMAVMFKDSEEAAERKEVTLNYSPNGMDSKTTEDQEQFKTDNIAESLEDMAVMFKDSEEAERKEEVTLDYSPNGMDSKTTEDQEQFKTDNIAESLEDMAVMFKDSEEAERKEEVTLDYSPNGMDSKTTEDQEQFKTDNIAESLEDMAVMFKDSEEAAERKEEVTLDYSPNGMDSKTTEDQEQFKTDNIAAESLEDMAVMFKDSEEAAERKEEVTLNYSPNGMDSKTTEDQEQFKTDNIAAESLEDMAVMFKDSEEAAEQKEEVNRQHHEEQNRQKQEHNCLDTEEEVVHKEKIADLTAETETKVFKKEIALEENEAMDVSFKTETIVEQDEAIQRQQVSDDTSRKVAILVKATSTLHKPVHHNILSDRLKVTVIGAGDEKTNINRGLWISGLYGVNKQGSWKNIPKYQGRTTGFTIGADAEFINNHDVIGIAYSNLESKIKYNKKLGKTAVYGHLLSIYGLKELIPGFSLHTIVSYGYNYIKNKSKNLDKIIGKYQNNNLSFQTLLNYKYCTKYNLHFIPSIGFKYDYSRASNYKEYNIDIENLMIQKKSNQSFESSIGGKIVSKPIIITNNTILTLSVHGNIERHFNNKNTKVNAKATFKKQTLQETIIIPKQPKFGYNIGNNILMSIKNINVLYEYNYYTHKKYHSHQGLIKLKINL